VCSYLDIASLLLNVTVCVIDSGRCIVVAHNCRASDASLQHHSPGGTFNYVHGSSLIAAIKLGNIALFEHFMDVHSCSAMELQLRSENVFFQPVAGFHLVVSDLRHRN